MSYVISATVGDGVHGLSCADLQAPITEAYALSHSDQVILEVLMQRSYLLAATAALALLVQTPLALGADGAGRRHRGTRCDNHCAGNEHGGARGDNDNAERNHRQFQPAPDAKKSASKKPAKKKMTRQQEIDHSVDSGTVPARYRSSVPKQYQQYVPFEKQ